MNKFIGLKEKLFNERGEIENNKKIYKELVKRKRSSGVNVLIKGMVGSI